jgi:DNA-binding MarR family transcriptional regulator
MKAKTERCADGITLLDRFHALWTALLDARISKSAAKVMAVLCEHGNTEGIAWPSLETLATLSGIARKNVGRALRELQGRGYIEVAESASPCRSTRHRLTLKDVEILRARIAEVRARRADSSAAPALTAEGTPASSLRAPLPSRVMLPGLTDDETLPSPLRPKPTTEPTRKGREVVGDSVGFVPSGHTLAVQRETDANDSTSDAFESFWRAYPKQLGRQRSRAEWDKQIATGADPAAMVDGAQRFARYVESAKVLDQYIKYPANFLAAQEWVNDFAVRTRKRSQSSLHSQHVTSAEEIGQRRECVIGLKQKLRRERFQKFETALREHVRGNSTAERVESLLRTACQSDRDVLKRFLWDSIDAALADARMLLTQAARNDWGTDDGKPATPIDLAPNEDLSMACAWFEWDGGEVGEYMIRAARSLPTASEPARSHGKQNINVIPAEQPRKQSNDSTRVLRVVEMIADGTKGYERLADKSGMTLKQARLAVDAARQQRLLKKDGRWFKPTETYH